MSDESKMQDIAAPWNSVADRIRALDAAGYPRAVIAAFLGKRYQHVRNVLVEDQRRRAIVSGAASAQAPGVSEITPEPWRPGDPSLAPKEGSSYLRLPIGSDGAIRLPADVETRMGFHRGGVVIARIHDDRVELLSVGEALRRVRELMRGLSPQAEGLADSLIADRRREAAAEEAS